MDRFNPPSPSKLWLIWEEHTALPETKKNWFARNLDTIFIDGAVQIFHTILKKARAYFQKSHKYDFHLCTLQWRTNRQSLWQQQCSQPRLSCWPGDKEDWLKFVHKQCSRGPMFSNTWAHLKVRASLVRLPTPFSIPPTSAEGTSST